MLNCLAYETVLLDSFLERRVACGRLGL